MHDHDSYPGRIEEMSYTGQGRRVVKFLTPDGARPWSVTVFEDSFYWTDSHDDQEALFKCNRYCNSSVTGTVTVV